MATRKTVQKAEQLRISNIGDVKARVGGLLELPSGIVIKWRNPGGLRAFLTSGKIPNVLLNSVEANLKGGKGVEEKLAQDMMAEIQKNPELLQQMMDLYDDVAIRCFVEPRLYRIPTEEDLEKWNFAHDDDLESPDQLRQDDRLYVDEIPDDDKAYLFQLLNGGVKDLATFRAEREINVDDLARVSGVVGHTVGDSGTDEG